MSSSKNIEHKGVIEEIHGAQARVKIQANSACSGCHAKGACGAADVQDKFVDVNLSNFDYHIGEHVLISLKQNEGFKALAWGYLYPLVLLITVLFVSLYFTGHEGKSGLLAILTLIPYYIFLYFSRDKIGKTFHFEMSKKN